LRKTAKVDLVPAFTLGNLGELVQLPLAARTSPCAFKTAAAAAAAADDVSVDAAPASCLTLETELMALGGSL
jgi:hypothetical protein